MNRKEIWGESPFRKGEKFIQDDWEPERPLTAASTKKQIQHSCDQCEYVSVRRAHVIRHAIAKHGKLETTTTEINENTVPEFEEIPKVGHNMCPISFFSIFKHLICYIRSDKTSWTYSMTIITINSLQ